MKGFVKNNRWALSVLLVSAISTGIGLAMHQQSAVLLKAIKICLECVGIG